MSQRVLDDASVSDLVLGLDRELQQTAIWAHLLSDEIIAGEMSFPINSMAELDPLFLRAEATDMPADPAGRAVALRRPEAEFVPPGIFPIRDMEQFVRAAYAVIVVVHTVAFDGPYHKH